MPVAHNGDARLSWRSVGPASEAASPEPVLMIMGLAGSSRAWVRLLPHVAAEHRAIVFDNRGTGDSSPVSGPLSMRDMAEDAVAVLDAAGVERAHVVGVSMGGMIAQHIALEHRARVASLVLACTTAGGRAGAPNWRLMVTAALRPAFGPGRTWRIVAPALYSERTRRNHRARLLEDLEIRVRDNTSPLTMYAQMAAIARHDTRTRLGQLEGTPTLVLHGDEDSLVLPERARELATAIPGARLVLVPQAGHVLSTDAELETAGAIVEHLAAARLSAPA
ncbi:MAG TPA: alpha/beta fold hydrolase [Solirubrobacteraceae bacterium]|nr:alpha/beta fold hydrolase [Solirubrobacteraceae bacterium]